MTDSNDLCINRHFDCLKNKLPCNWTNHNSTAYYNRAFWNRCKCEYGPFNACKETADKWNPVATEPTKWTKGCSPCSSNYNRPPSWYYTYNPDNCGNNCNHNHHDNHHDNHHGNHDNHNNHDDNCNNCDNNDNNYCECNNGTWNMFGNICNKCNKKCNKTKYHENNGNCGKCGNNGNCNDCCDVSVVYRMVNGDIDCDNIVELKIPPGGSKEFYLAKFSPEFIYANRFQCATVPVYNSLPNNVVDNMREEEFTLSDQAALTRRGINNAKFAQQMIDDGKIIHERHSFSIPMNVCGRSAYYYFGDCNDAGSTENGLGSSNSYKGFFG